MEQLCSHWTDSHEIWYLSILVENPSRKFQVSLKYDKNKGYFTWINTGCFTTYGHYCRRWFPRSLWSEKFIQTCFRFWTVTELWAFFNSQTRRRVNRVLRNQPAGGLSFAKAATSNSRSSQPSGSLCCSRRWHFRIPALSTDQFKLNVISRS